MSKREGREAAIAVRSERRPGHFWADNELLDVYGPRIGAYGIALYMALSRFARNDTGEATVSLARLCTMLALSKNTVLRARRRLEEEGLLEVQSAVDGRAAVYVLQAVEKALPRRLEGVHHVNTPEAGGCSPGEQGVFTTGTGGVHVVNTPKEYKTGKTDKTFPSRGGGRRAAAAAPPPLPAPAADGRHRVGSPEAMAAWREACGWVRQHVRTPAEAAREVGAWRPPAPELPRRTALALDTVGAQRVREALLERPREVGFALREFCQAYTAVAEPP